MKNFFIVLLLGTLITGFSGCLKESADEGGCTNKTPASEAPAMQAYASANGFSVTPHSSGILYQVINPGTGPVPTGASRVFVKYTGKLTANNAVFDQQPDHQLTGWRLDALIQGWQVGLPLIGEGGTIRLIIPSALAYGCRGFGIIPGDATLFFEIELVDVQ